MPISYLIVRPFRYFLCTVVDDWTVTTLTTSDVIVMNRSVLTLLVSCWWTQVCNEMSW